MTLTVAAKTLFSVCAGPRLLRRLATPRLFVFNYHRIRDPRRPIRFDEDVYGPDQSEFAKQVRWITTHFELLSEQHLIDVVESSRPLNRHCATITFDDGYRDNYELAYPVLRKFNASAIFFVPTFAISERQLGWWDVIAWTIRHTRLRRFTLRGCEFDIDQMNVCDVIRRIIAMRQAPEVDSADAFVDDLARAAGVDPPDRRTQDAELMTWDQLRELSRNQMAIGSHTHSHDVLSQLDIDVQRRELALSKSLLESELGQPVLSLSYPVGLYEHFHRETKEIARQCGYRLAFSFLTGLEIGRIADAYDIRRTYGARTLIEMDIATSMPGLYYTNRSALREPRPYAAR